MNIAQVLAEKISASPSDFKRHLKPSLLGSFGLSSTCPEEVISVSQTIRTTHSKGVDDIDPYIASLSIGSVATPLAEIINCSFSAGEFPQALKIAKVIPIYKKGKRDDLTNYRPISILPYFSKYFEKLMYNRLYEYIVKNNILFPTQHGFQSGHSPYMSLLNMQDKIANAVENNEYSLGVFFDLAKAFDTVNHNILLRKLENYGIRNTQLNWFSSYFEGRLQYVYCRGARSALRTILHGVPQGSNLGPLLFLIYINDLPNVSNSLFFILFADDTNVFFSHKSLDTLFQIVNTELELVAEWFSDNRLTVNLDKTNYILFKSHRKTGSSHGHHKICINSISLSRVSSTRFLGVYVDQHLDWKDHINNISSKVARNVGILARASHFLSQTVKIKLYYALVFPYLAYCNLVWASTYNSRLLRLITLQKRAIRIIAGVPYGSHTKQLFLDLNLLNVPQIRTYQIGEFMFRYDRGLLPPAYNDFFGHVSKVHSHYTRNSTKYRRIFARTNTRRFSIRFLGVSVWEEIPLTIRMSSNVYIFKRKLRTHLVGEIVK